MNETRRGAVILIGDSQIAGAIAEGMLAGRAERRGHLIRPLAGAPSPQGEGFWRGGPEALPAEQIEVVEAEIDRQRIQMALLRVAVGNHKSAEDYAALVTKARGDYGMTRRPPGTARKVGKKLLGLYGLLCYTVARAYRSQERVLGNSLSHFVTAPSGREP